MTFINKLRTAQEKRDSWLCVGLDPTPELMPDGISVLDFNRAMIAATSEHACAYKLNLAFYLSYGPQGLHDLQGTVAAVPDDIPTILDAKFGDISYTAQHYARAAFEQLGVDAVTISPYVGMDAVTPLLDYTDKMAFVLVRSSNTTGNDFQFWPSERAPLYRYVTAQLNTLARDYPDQLGILVGATQAPDLINIRSWAPTLPFLIPGIGVQQGDLDIAVEHGVSRTGIGPLIAVSRSIIYASANDDYTAAAQESARSWVAQIRDARQRHHGE